MGPIAITRGAGDGGKKLVIATAAAAIEAP